MNSQKSYTVPVIVKYINIVLVIEKIALYMFYLQHNFGVCTFHNYCCLILTSVSKVTLLYCSDQQLW